MGKKRVAKKAKPQPVVEKEKVVEEKPKVSKRGGKKEKVTPEKATENEAIEKPEKNENSGKASKKVKKVLVEITNLSETINTLLPKCKNYTELLKTLQSDFTSFSIVQVNKIIAKYEEDGTLLVNNNTYSFEQISNGIEEEEEVEIEQEPKSKGTSKSKETPTKSTKKSGKKSSKKSKTDPEEENPKPETFEAQEEPEKANEEAPEQYDLPKTSLLEEGNTEEIN